MLASTLTHDDYAAALASLASDRYEPQRTGDEQAVFLLASTRCSKRSPTASATFFIKRITTAFQACRTASCC
jgi:hypothetical protein